VKPTYATANDAAAFMGSANLVVLDVSGQMVSVVGSRPVDDGFGERLRVIRSAPATMTLTAATTTIQRLITGQVSSVAVAVAKSQMSQDRRARGGHASQTPGGRLDYCEPA